MARLLDLHPHDFEALQSLLLAGKDLPHEGGRYHSVWRKPQLDYTVQGYAIERLTLVDEDLEQHFLVPRILDELLVRQLYDFSASWVGRLRLLRGDNRVKYASEAEGCWLLFKHFSIADMVGLS